MEDKKYNSKVKRIEHLIQKYKTIWEISQKAIIEQAADRGAYICQSQSLNIFMENANFGKLTSMHFYGWEKGLKTGMYYLRTKAATDAIKFTVEKTVVQEPTAKSLEEQAAALKQLNLAFSDSGTLCLSFADKDLLAVKTPCGLDQLSRFRQSIEQPTSLPKLSQLLHTIHQLLRHSDTNF